MLAVKSPLLQKIENTQVAGARRVALAYSGGLDSSLCAVLAREKYQVETLYPITVQLRPAAGTTDDRSPNDEHHPIRGGPHSNRPTPQGRWARLKPSRRWAPRRPSKWAPSYPSESGRRPRSRRRGLPRPGTVGM